MKPRLTVQALQEEARRFATTASGYPERSLYGVTDGKAVGTYFEHKFKSHLGNNYTYAEGSTAKGIDFPDLGVDIKVTSIKQPQSSCAYKSARQKIFGLGYALLVFVYDKQDDDATRTGRLSLLHTVFIEAQRTADYQMTRGILEILARDGNAEDLIAFMSDRNLPVDEIEAGAIAVDVLRTPPSQGYLTISNALQWRLQYARVIEKAGTVDGILRLR
jgi:hypothetical protein